MVEESFTLIPIKRMCEIHGGCHPSIIWRRVQDGTIAPPIKIAGRALWDEHRERARIRKLLEEAEDKATARRNDASATEAA